MAFSNLEEFVASTDDLVAALRNSQIGAYVYPVVAPEFSNWRDEQMAWRETAVLFDQSHHMAELLVEGPEALKLLSGLGVNSFDNFGVNRAKHFVACNHDGRVIGDVILFHFDTGHYNLVGRVPTVNWVEYNATTGDYDVMVSRDDRSPSRPGGKPVVRRHYRFQIQGPNAMSVLEELNGAPVPDIPFFRCDKISLAGRKVDALRHGMAGVPGLEVWGAYEQYDEVREAILAAGEPFGLVPVGARAYATNTLESGWIPSPLPAVYTGESMKEYRQWLPGAGYEATASIGGSFIGSRIEDYYLTPYQLGYGFYVKFDHEFIGADALRDMSDLPHRRKVTLEWNPEDVGRVLTSIFEPPGENNKIIDLPLSNYAAASYDSVVHEGRNVGFSMFAGYSANERAMLSLGVVDPEFVDGDILTLVWGEEGGGTTKTTVERHKQTEIRVKVAPVPYSEAARESYSPGWRTASV